MNNCTDIYRLEKLKKIRKRAYIVVILLGWINIFFPFVAHADILGNEVEDVYVAITDSVFETNAILRRAFSFCYTSPYDVINYIDGTGHGTTLVAIVNASKDTALVVAILLLMVDFFRKSVNFEWSSKWENVLLFLVKLIVIKQVIQNADVIVADIYAGFNYINTRALNALTGSGATVSFLPDGDYVEYTKSVKEGFFNKLMHQPFFDFLHDEIVGDTYIDFSYGISHDAVKMFYPDASFPGSTYLDDSTHFSIPTSTSSFTPTIELAFLQPYFLIMKAIAYLIFVIAAGRVFELSVLTIFAPLPIATFASETSSDVARNFIKNYIATVLQIGVIVAMFMVYVALSSYIKTLFGSTPLKLMELVILISLGLGVMKSGAWAKKITGLG